MFCPNCGAGIRDGSKFCPACGSPLEMSATRNQPPGALRIYPDGVYRWIYEYNMLKNPVIFVTILKVLGIPFGLGLLLVGFTSFQNGMDSFLENIGIMAIVGLVILAISGLSYLIVAGQYGWKYIVIFEMDERGVKHAQQPKQFEKAQAMGLLAAVAGGSLSARAAGYNAAMHSSIFSDFAAVKSIIADKKRSTIKVNETLNKNQVYADGADFDFVLQYIIDRCPNAKVRIK